MPFRVWFVIVLVAIAFWVFTIVDCAVQPPARHRGVSKTVWMFIVVLLPVLGGILWLVVGRVPASAVAQRRAPDDDPEFLGRIGTISDQDERIRRLEEELAQLDAEGDDPRFKPSTGPAAAEDAPPGAATASGGPVAPGAPPTPPLPTDGDDDARGQRGALG